MINDAVRLRDRPYRVAPTQYLLRVGEGDAGLVGAEIAQFQEYNTPPPVACVVYLSPRAPGQKCYFVMPAASPDFAVYLHGFLVTMLADRTETVAGVSCRVKETEDLHVGTDLPFEVRSL